MTGDVGSGNWTCAENSMRYSRVLWKEILLEKTPPRQVLIIILDDERGC